MTAVSDSTIFRNILSTQESAVIWNDRTRTRYYLDFEAALARVQAKLDIIPDDASQAINAYCKIENINWPLLEQRTETIGYPVLGVVKQVVEDINKVTPGLGEWTHWGATTQDLTDTATILQLRDTLNLVERELGSIITSLEHLCEKYKATPMAARSNLQQAVPISFGFKMARLLSTFLRHRTRLAELRSRLLVLEFSGAAGTLATLTSTSKALKCQRGLAQELGLAVPDIAWHTERDRIAEAGQLFALLTSTCAKFALDVKLMMQTEVGEVSEPYEKDRGSSSTMPQKRNPISCAYITAMAASVRALSSTLCEAMVEDHERSTGPWEIEWITLPAICTQTHATLAQTARLLSGLEVHEDAMAANLQLTKGAIVSEAVMMGLAPSLGRQYAHDLIYDLCQRAVKEKTHLVDLLDGCEEVKMQRSELERLCDPANYLGESVVMVERVLELSRASR